MIDQIVLFCYDYFKNNSYINLVDGNHIRIVWSCSNAVKTHNVSYISLQKILATGRPVAKILIKYNKNNLEEHDEEDREPIHIELNEGKTDPYNDKNTIDFRWSDVKNEKDIALVNFI